MKIVERILQGLTGSTLYILIAGAVGLLLVIFWNYGWAGLSEAVTQDIRLSAGRFVSIIVVFILIMGAIGFLARKNPTRVRDIINGKEGQMKMLILSAAMPGPSGAKELRSAWESGKVKTSQGILCLTAMMAAGVTMLMFRGSFLGPQLTMIWIGISWGLVAVVWLIGRIF